MTGSNFYNDISRPQKALIHAMLTKLKLADQKANLVLGFTGGRTEHSSEMSRAEAADFIKYLKSQDPDEQACDRMRKKIISMAHQCGYRIPGTEKVDTQRLDDWCRKYGQYHRPLNSHSKEELTRLVTQFENVYKSYLNKD